MKTRFVEEQAALIDAEERDEEEANAGSKKKQKPKQTIQQKRAELQEKADNYAKTVHKDIVRAAGGSLTKIGSAA